MDLQSSSSSIKVKVTDKDKLLTKLSARFPFELLS